MKIERKYPWVDLFSNNSIATVGAGEDYREIDDAIAVLGSSGGIILVKNGNYNPCTLSSNITLVAESYNAVINIPDNSTENGIIIDGCDNVKITGIKINGNKSNVDTSGELYLTINGILIANSTNIIIDGNYCAEAYYGGIAVDGSSDITIKDNKCVDNRDNGIFIRPNNVNINIYGNMVKGSEYSGIQALRSDYVNITNNISHEVVGTLGEGDGIGLEGCRYSRIADNIIYSNGIQGVKIDYTLEGDVTEQRSLDCVVENNTIYNHVDIGNGSGIEVLRSDNTIIRNNHIKTCKYGINIGEVVNIKIVGNDISNTTDQGIRLYNTSATGVLVIRENTIDGSGGNQIECFQDNVLILNNIIKNGAGQGIYLSAGNSSVIEGNQIFDNGDNGIIIGSNNGNSLIKNNVFFNTATGGQTRALYEVAGTGATILINNNISGMAYVPYELQRDESYVDRISPRVKTITTSGSPVINSDRINNYSITALSEDVYFDISGSPEDFQRLVIRIKDDSVSRAISWSSSFEAKGVSLPTTTTPSKTINIEFVYDANSSKWGCIYIAEEI